LISLLSAKVVLDILYNSVQEELTSEEDRAVLRKHDVHLPTGSQQQSTPSSDERLIS
jgi:hypothetical protein